MRAIFLEGGVPMWFLLALGVLALGSAASFAGRPSKTSERFLHQLSRATLFAALVSVALAAGTTLHQAGREMPHEQRIRQVVVGLGESTAPAVLGFGVLAIVSLLRAIGNARLGAREAE